MGEWTVPPSSGPGGRTYVPFMGGMTYSEPYNPTPGYMSVNDPIGLTAEAIRSMEIRGAGRIARAGAKAMRDFASSYSGEDAVSAMNKAADVLIDSRPTAVSLWNGVKYSIRGISRSDDVPASVMRNADEFITRSYEAVERISCTGADMISDGDTLLTHCNSSAAISVMKKAHSQGKRFKAYACETRPWGQGYITIKQLTDAGIDATLIVDSCVATVMEDVDHVFVGADTVTANGDLYNKVGTKQISIMAKEYEVPIHSCAETYKFSPLTLEKDRTVIEERDKNEVLAHSGLDQSISVFNPVFDKTPGKYLTGFITEEGVVKPTEARDVVENLLRILE